MATRLGRLQLMLGRHQTYQEGDEFSLSKFAEKELIEKETNDDILVEIDFTILNLLFLFDLSWPGGYISIRLTGTVLESSS